jgi:hypothetical protein
MVYETRAGSGIADEPQWTAQCRGRAGNLSDRASAAIRPKSPSKRISAAPPFRFQMIGIGAGRSPFGLWLRPAFGKRIDSLPILVRRFGAELNFIFRDVSIE